MTRSLRICLLVHSTLPRGGVVHALELGDALSDAGHDVDLCAPAGDGAGLFRAPRSLRCRFVPIPVCKVEAADGAGAMRVDAIDAKVGADDIPAMETRDAKLVAWVAQRIQDWLQYFDTTPGALDYDIYHAQDSVSANALANLVERGHIAAYTRTVHHLDVFDDARLSAWQTRGFMAARQVFCVSERWQDRLWHDHGIRAARVSNGVDRLRFSPAYSPQDDALRVRLSLHAASISRVVPTSAGAPASPVSGPVFLSVGGIESRKNTVNALAAFILVRRHHPGARWLIAGGASVLDHGAYVQHFREAIRIAEQADENVCEVEERICVDESEGTHVFPSHVSAMPRPAALPLSAAIQLLGRVDDAVMPSLFRIADALLFPSLNEGFGLVVLEALACATPVITSRIAPFTEYLPPEAVEWADPEAPQSIADAMLAALADRGHAHRQQRRHAGFDVCDTFGWARSASTHLTLYRALLADLQSDFPMETSHA